MKEITPRFGPIYVQLFKPAIRCYIPGGWNLVQRSEGKFQSLIFLAFNKLFYYRNYFRKLCFVYICSKMSLSVIFMILRFNFVFNTYWNLFRLMEWRRQLLFNKSTGSLFLSELYYNSILNSRVRQTHVINFLLQPVKLLFSNYLRSPGVWENKTSTNSAIKQLALIV